MARILLTPEERAEQAVQRWLQGGLTPTTARARNDVFPAPAGGRRPETPVSQAGPGAESAGSGRLTPEAQAQRDLQRYRLGEVGTTPDGGPQFGTRPAAAMGSWGAETPGGWSERAATPQSGGIHLVAQTPAGAQPATSGRKPAASPAPKPADPSPVLPGNLFVGQKKEAAPHPYAQAGREFQAAQEASDAAKRKQTARERPAMGPPEPLRPRPNTVDPLTLRVVKPLKTVTVRSSVGPGDPGTNLTFQEDPNHPPLVSWGKAAGRLIPGVGAALEGQDRINDQLLAAQRAHAAPRSVTLAPEGSPERKRQEASLARLQPLMEAYNRQLLWNLRTRTFDDVVPGDGVAPLLPNSGTRPNLYLENGKRWNWHDFGRYLQEHGIQQLTPWEKQLLNGAITARKIEWANKAATDGAIAGEVAIFLAGEIAGGVLAPYVLKGLGKVGRFAGKTPLARQLIQRTESYLASEPGRALRNAPGLTQGLNRAHQVAQVLAPTPGHVQNAIANGLQEALSYSVTDPDPQADQALWRLLQGGTLGYLFTGGLHVGAVGWKRLRSAYHQAAGQTPAELQRALTGVLAGLKSSGGPVGTVATRNLTTKPQPPAAARRSDPYGIPTDPQHYPAALDPPRLSKLESVEAIRARQAAAKVELSAADTRWYRKHGGRLYSGIDPEAVLDALPVARALVKYGVASAEELVTRLGQHLKDQSEEFRRAVVAALEKEDGPIGKPALAPHAFPPGDRVNNPGSSEHQPTGTVTPDVQQGSAGNDPRKAGTTPTQLPNARAPGVASRQGFASPEKTVNAYQVGDRLTVQIGGKDVDAVFVGGTSRKAVVRLSTGQEKYVPWKHTRPSGTFLDRLGLQVSDVELESMAQFHDDVLAGRVPEGDHYTYRVTDAEEAAFLQRKTGLPVSTGTTHVVPESDLRHLVKPKAKEREQHLPVTREDIRRIPEITANADEVRRGKDDPQTGLATIEYQKRINGHVIYVEVLHHKPNRLLARSIRKVTADGGHPSGAANPPPKASP